MKGRARMKMLGPIRFIADGAFAGDVRTHLAAADAERLGTGRRRPLARWPVALRRSIADGRLRRERTFWQAVARTTDKP